MSQILQDAVAGLCKLKAAVSSTVLLGDFNIRQEEESTMLKLIQGAMGKKQKTSSADYSGQSWAPMQNRFKAGGPRVAGFAFDRVFYHGDAYAASCLVGHARVHAFTSRFALSDHFAVRSVLALGLDEGKEDQPHRVGRFQGHVNMVLGKLSREEQNFLDVTEMDAKHSFHSRLAQEKHVGEQLSRKEAEQRNKEAQEQQRKRKAHWDGIFGDDLSFFSGGLAEAFSDLPELQFDSASFFLLCPAIGSADIMPCLSGIPRAGFYNAGNTCYVSVIAQVLLRLPAVNKFLQAHSKNCQEGISRCVTCCLWESRQYLGKGKAPPLADRRKLVSDRFSDGAQHDALEFLGFFIDEARASEIRAGRTCCMPLPISFPERDAKVTSLDTLFLTMEERRFQCDRCGKVRAERTASYIMKLPLPTEETFRERSGAISPAELYNTFCARTPVDFACCRTPRCQEQRRHLGRPEILLIQVRRESSSERLERHQVFLEDNLTLDDGTKEKMGSWRLDAVIFHHGQSMQSGHYTCACRDASGRFYYFDDRRVTPLESLNYYWSRAYLLIYCKI